MANKDRVPSPRILLVEDSKMAARMLSTAISKRTQLPIDHAETFAAARELLAQHGPAYRAAVVDIGLPDAPDGEAVDLVCSSDIATVVMTGNINEEIRDRILTKPIVDYVPKQIVSAVDYVANLVRRVVNNQSIKVLVVDDSDSFRAYLRRLLEVHRLEVLVASDGFEAQELLRHHPDVQMILVDYEMPGMSGVELTAALRARHNRSKTCIIGVTGSDNPYIGAQFLKAGADDILRKPFIVEEFYVRVVNHLDTLDHIQLMERYASHDYLTGLHNRRYLYEHGEAMLSKALRNNQKLLVAMIDIDLFKGINDNYGHKCGDQALVEVSRCLLESFPSPNLVARMGGEEFCVIGMLANDPYTPFEQLRRKIEALSLEAANGQKFGLTISAGVTIVFDEDIDRMIARADAALYQAKQSGRNRVMLAG